MDGGRGGHFLFKLIFSKQLSEKCGEQTSTRSQMRVPVARPEGGSRPCHHAPPACGPGDTKRHAPWGRRRRTERPGGDAAERQLQAGSLGPLSPKVQPWLLFSSSEPGAS